MRIHAIAIKDFTCYEATTVFFDNTVNVIVSENAGGKTSLVDAITYCLTGHCARTDGAGRGAEAMISTGAKEAGVGLQIGPYEPYHVVSRNIPGGLSIDSNDGGQRELQDYLYKIVGAGEGAVTAALNTSDFLCMKPDEQKALLFGLMGLDLSEERILGMITEEVPKQHYQAMCRLLDAIPNKLLQGGPAEVFDHLYEHYYNLRRVTKRQLKDLGEQPQLSMVPDSPDKDRLLGEVEGLEQLLYDARSKRDKATEVRDRAASLEVNIAHIKKQLKDAGNPEAAARELKIIEEEIAEARLDEKTLRARTDILREAIIALEKAGATKQCPLAPGVISCPITKSKRQALLKELEGKVAGLEKEADNARESAEFLMPRREDLAVRATVSDKAMLMGSLKRLKTDLKELPTAIDPALLEPEILDLQKQIAERQSNLEEVVRAEGAREAVEKQADERARLADEVEVLEVLVELTSPKGIPGRLLAGTIGPLQELANERLSQLTDGRYQLRLEVDPDFSIVVSHDGAESDLKRLSSSERLRIGVILQDAVSRLSGLRVMMIDNADALDPQNRALLMDLLLEIKADYDSIIVLSTIGPNGVENPHIDDVTVYLIEDGKIEKVE